MERRARSVDASRSRRHQYSAAGTVDCARLHGRRDRKRVRDLSTGDEFLGVPILRVRLCSGAAPSLMPVELWLGRSTLASVVETVVHVQRDRVEAVRE